MSPVTLLRSLLLAVCLSVALAFTAVAQDIPAESGAEFVIPSVQVEIADSGVQPSVITVTVGAQVFWTNSTGRQVRIGDQPLAQEEVPLYLPLVTAPGVSAAAVDDQSPAAQPAATSWSSDPIPAAGQYSHTFSQAGEFSYYASHLPGAIGKVVVLSDTLATTVLVDSETGGVVEAGGSRLEIPPGALAQDTVIVVSEPITGMTMQADGMKAVSLEPSGLQFSQPATLTVAYGDTGEHI